MTLPRFVDPERRPLLLRLIANGLGQAALAIVAMLATRAAFDDIVGGAEATSLAAPAGALAAAAIGSALLALLQRTDSERLGQSYARRVRSLLFKRLTRTPPRSLQRKSRGGLALRLSTDVTALRQWASLGVARLCTAGVTAAITLGALAAMNTPIALAVTVVLAAGTALSALVGPPLAAANKEARRRRALLATNMAEKLGATAVLQVHHRLHREQRRVERQGRRLERAMVESSRWTGALRALGEATSRLAALAALVVGAFEVRSGAATAGSIVAAVAVVALLGPAIRDLGRAFELWSKARQARVELAELFRIGTPVRNPTTAADLGPGAGAIEFRDVTVTAASGAFNGRIAARSRVAIVGANGGGKSTLLWLAARLVEPAGGQITLDGCDLATLSLRSLRRAIGIAGDGLPLVRGTIRDNITYRRPDATAEAIAAACHWAGLEATLQRLPAGIDTRLGDQGATLSEGERQRVALARAVMGRPRLLLLDEVDANLDAPGRAWVASMLRTYEGTVLFVSHDRDWIRAADLVWYVADGAIVEAGPPRELLQGKGPTATAFATLRAAS
jgi:ABC-type multidrug transport system fused ATPase/permease subunit